MTKIFNKNFLEATRKIKSESNVQNSLVVTENCYIVLNVVEC